MVLVAGFAGRRPQPDPLRHRLGQRSCSTTWTGPTRCCARARCGSRSSAPRSRPTTSKHIIIDLAAAHRAAARQVHACSRSRSLVGRHHHVRPDLLVLEAVDLNLTERPVEYEMLGADGGRCTSATRPHAQLDELEDFEQADAVLRRSRSCSRVFGVPAETPGAAFQLIVPLMFFVIVAALPRPRRPLHPRRPRRR